MRRIKRAQLLVPIVAVAIAGCGGDDDEEARAPSPGTDTGANGGMTVDLDEFSIEPMELTASRGDRLTVRNVGAIDHNLTIERGPDPDQRTDELAATPTFGGGASDTLDVDIEAGRYALVCTVGNHRELGMVGSITVR